KTFRHGIKLITILTLFLCPPILSSASDTDEIPISSSEVIQFSAQAQPRTVRLGEIFRIAINISLKQGWHIYSVIPQENLDAPPPTKLVVKPGILVTEGPVYETRPVIEFIKSLDLTIIYHDKQAVLYQNLKLKDGVAAGSYNSEIIITFQICTDSICLPAEEKTLFVPIEVQAGNPRDEYLVAERGIGQLPEPGISDNIPGMLSNGVWAFISLAALMGLVSLLTPCVFPMIPITVSFFSKQAEGRQSRVIKLAVLFAAGIIATYTGIGLILSVIFGAGSALLLASNPYVNITIALVFIVFALSLMGLFDIKPPSGLEMYFDNKARTTGGALGVLLMGVAFTLTAFTCTVQFVGTMLIAAAQGEWIWPLLGMLVFSTVFAFPFFLLAIIPGLIKKLRGKSGAWLGRSKVVLGILELMASVKFLSNADLVWQTNLISRDTAIRIWIFLMAGIVVYLIWTGIRPKLNRSALQWSNVTVFIVLSVLLTRGLNDRSLGSLIDAVLPPTSGLHLSTDSFVSIEESKKAKWLNSFEEARKYALLENKPILLEFTGYTCVNCRWMEQNILSRKEIHRQLTDKFILARLFTDGGEDASRNLKLQIEMFKTVALPLYVILSKDGVPQRQFSGISINPEEFLDFLLKDFAD
ncbi:thioredoxin family protein, partial [bacterium]|nr:thioredoxin family protein [bacterium]